MTLKNAFDKDKFVIEDIEYTDNDLQAMSFDGLETLRMQINKKISGLTAAISEKKTNRAENERNMRRKVALSINKRVLTYVIYLINKHKLRERKFSDYFMDAAKAVLPQEDYELIMSNAHREKKLKEQEEAAI